MRKLVGLDTVYKMDHLIRKAATGSSEEFANYLGISRSSLFELIEYLTDKMRAPIVYYKRKKTFEYEYIPRFFIGFDESWKPFEDPDIEKGGKSMAGRNEYSEEDNSDMIDDDLDSTELNEIYGGKEDEDWDTNSIDGDSEDISLNEGIDFNDLFPD
jgi:hypothetical protein